MDTPTLSTRSPQRPHGATEWGLSIGVRHRDERAGFGSRPDKGALNTPEAAPLLAIAGASPRHRGVWPDIAAGHCANEAAIA